MLRERFFVQRLAAKSDQHQFSGNKSHQFINTDLKQAVHTLGKMCGWLLSLA